MCFTPQLRELGYRDGVAVDAQGRFANGTSAGRSFPQGPRDMRVHYANVHCIPTDQELDDCERPLPGAYSPECRARNWR